MFIKSKASNKCLLTTTCRSEKETLCKVLKGIIFPWSMCFHMLPFIFLFLKIKNKLLKKSIYNKGTDY